MKSLQLGKKPMRTIRPHLLLIVLTFSCLFLGVVSIVTVADTHNAPANVHKSWLSGEHGHAPSGLPVRSDVTVPHVDEDCANTRCVALTFDDGPSTATTPAVLDVLSRHKAKATFFVVGTRAAQEGALLREIYTRGHEIGNHSWSHADLTQLTRGQILQQVNQTQAAVVTAGVPAPTLFRPPYGATNELVRSTIPMTLAFWNTDPKDWDAKTPQAVYDQIMAHIRPGSVIVMHDTSPMTAQALESVIVALSPQYKFVTFSDLFDLQHSQPGMYFGR